MTVTYSTSHIQGRNPLYTSCQKDYQNVAYKSDSDPDDHWRPDTSKVVNEVNLDDGFLVKANSYGMKFTESVENSIYVASS